VSRWKPPKESLGFGPGSVRALPFYRVDQLFAFFPRGASSPLAEPVNRQPRSKGASGSAVATRPLDTATLGIKRSTIGDEARTPGEARSGAGQADKDWISNQ
jgi:hypothetical protein